MDIMWQTRSAKSFLEAWTDASQHMTESILKANQATLSAINPATNGSTKKEREEESVYEGGDEVVDLEDWETESSVSTKEELGVGEYVKFTKTLNEKDVERFAFSSGDTNPLHLNQEFAEGTRFGGRIVHGTLVSGLISAALARIPGLTIYLSQDVKFLKPVEIGERVTGVCEIVEDLGDEKYRLTTRIQNAEGETVIDGEAIVLIDSKPDKR